MQKKYLKIFTFFSLFSFLFTSHVALAASLYIKPSAITVNEEDTFTASIDIDTEGQSINVAEAGIQYPQDMLSVVSVQSGKTFSIKTPGSPKKQTGQVFFSAGVASGYTGKAVLGTVTFRAKKAGKVELTITNGSTLLNDGNATEALTGVSAMKITILKAGVKTEPTPVVETPTPAQTVVPEVVPAPVPVVTPAPVPVVVSTESVVTIPMSDVLTFVYILLGCIVLLVVAVIMLVITLTVRTQKQRSLPSDKKKV